MVVNNPKKATQRLEPIEFSLIKLKKRNDEVITASIIEEHNPYEIAKLLSDNNIDIDCVYYL